MEQSCSWLYLVRTHKRYFNRLQDGDLIYLYLRSWKLINSPIYWSHRYSQVRALAPSNTLELIQRCLSSTNQFIFTHNKCQWECLDHSGDGQHAIVSPKLLRCKAFHRLEARLFAAEFELIMEAPQLNVLCPRILTSNIERTWCWDKVSNIASRSTITRDYIYSISIVTVGTERILRNLCRHSLSSYYLTQWLNKPK